MQKRKQIYRELIALVVSAPALYIVMQAGSAFAAPTTDAVVSVCDEAHFDSALATVQASPGGTITFTCGPATITFSFIKSISKNVVIDGGSAITLSGGNITGLFQVFFGRQLTLVNITLANASSGSQGAIQSFGSLTLSNCIMANNRASGGHGGAINNSGVMTMTNCTLSNNRASTGGAIYVEGGASASINSSTIFSNAAASYGGGIYNVGTITLTNSTLSSNVITDVVSTSRGGGAFNSGLFTMNGGSVINNHNISNAIFSFTGGGLQNGDVSSPATMTLTSVTIQGNIASAGGGIENIDSKVTLQNTTVVTNSSGVTGGGVDNCCNSSVVNIFNSQILSNTSALGGGIYNGGGATVNISQTRVSGNMAAAAGGLRNYVGSFMNVYQSLIYSNVVSVTGSAARGGGLANRGIFYAENTTFSGNIANDNLGTSQGGAILNEETAYLSLRNVTISDNKANIAGSICSNGNTTGPCGSGGSTATLDLGNTIVANSRDPDTNALNNNCVVVAMFDEHGNIESTHSCGLAASVFDTDPLLGPLANYGGPTLSYLPLPGSPAINNGTGLTGCPSKDQRGFARPNTVANPCDIGSIEVGPRLYLPLIIK